ncbi:PilX N-terminal domain-containing pilus assembly protein [Vulcaniibacterium gelatinicum]|uniref:PilX N-terminal domain-containing pilus assembly protein n=1 Tax=Vulcaniibacterium gelatinicum TaxID=2598725 RepID=UPI0011CA190D|nr:PilX N-terminal domain-containing pilus assembly protein [Vulcaniibacterium gelatinicum]
MPTRRHLPTLSRSQAGITTLAITLILLVILTLIVLFSTNVAFFEQRTTTSENRAEITQQAAEYALNLAGEYLKANRDKIIANTGAGWLTPGSAKWVRCPTGLLANEGGPVPVTHPCAAERLRARREQMYYFDNDPSTATIDGLPYTTIAGALTGVRTGEGAATYNATTTVNAVLCRIGSDLTPASPSFPCAANPATGNNIAVTLIAETSLPGENAAATIKETWATTTGNTPAAAVPLIASGFVRGLGNAEIVASPNAGGYGVPGSIWSPNNVDIEVGAGCAGGGGGIGSVSTCHVGEYLRSTPREDLKTTCATSNNACGCPAVTATGSDYLSGHSGSVRREGLDVLDRDCNAGSLPDITFFPREPYDNPNDPSDDSLFEYTFNVNYVVAEGGTTVLSNCGTSGTQNCAAYALIEELGATVLSDCSSLGTGSSGIFYVTGNCDLGNFGSPTGPVILVVDGNVSINGNVTFYGMLFARSNNNSAEVRGNGNVKIFGSMIVEGDVDLGGNIDIVYDDTSASSCTTCFPASAKFGKVPGSWLDSRTGI